MDGLEWHDRPRPYFFIYFIPQGQTVTAEYYATEILEKEVRPLSYRESNPVVEQGNPSEF